MKAVRLQKSARSPRFLKLVSNITEVFSLEKTPVKHTLLFEKGRIGIYLKLTILFHNGIVILDSR